MEATEVTLLSSEWRSKVEGVSTIIRELAIQLAKHPSLHVSVYLPKCGDEDKRVAASYNVQLIEAEEMAGYDPVDWLSVLPEDHAVDYVIGFGTVLGRQVQIIKRHYDFKWIQVVYNVPEELGAFKYYSNAIDRADKMQQVEVKLCEKADQVVAVGPKVTEAFLRYLRKDQEHVFNLTPGILSDFANVQQATEELKAFRVLLFGQYCMEDFYLNEYHIAACAIAELKIEPQPYALLFAGAQQEEQEIMTDLFLNEGVERTQLLFRPYNGSREQLARLFCEADLAIMPSQTVGFGVAALEALSAGLPILVSGRAGFGEALGTVLHGAPCVVNSADPKVWANAIRAVRQKDRKIRLEESKAVREAYGKKYSWEEQCSRLVERMRNITLADKQ